jgi:glycosyltransferase involved in cell wall biosynthesis
VDPERLPRPDQALLDRAVQSWKREGMKVLSVGRLTYYKGFDVLIRAAEKVPNISVQIVGEGALAAVLNQTILEKGLQDRVLLRGSLPDAELRALLCSCDCFCLPSIERTEAFGLVLLEAMRYGRAIVASDIPGSGVGWVVRKGECGHLFPPGNVQALADILSGLSGDAGKSRMLGERGKKAFDQSFHIDAIMQEIRTLYKEAINET